jgi:Na+-driven multidrug efflux pump
LDALWYILQQPTWQRFPLPMQSLTWAYPLTQAASLSVWAFEQAAPLLLLAYWYRETRERPGYLRARFNALDFRTLYLLFGVGMHIGIEALMEVGPFSIASLTLYLACFHPDEWSRLFNRLRMSGSSPVPARL